MKEGRKKILKETFFWSYFATNSCEDQMVNKQNIKLIMIGMALKKTIVLKAWLKDFEDNKSIYSGNSGKMDG